MDYISVIWLKDLTTIARQGRRQTKIILQRLFRTIPEIITGPAQGLRFDIGFGTNLFATGNYERPVQEALASLAKPGGVCYDIGANLGFFSALLARLVGTNGLVYAFEPVPDNVLMIEKNGFLNSLRNIEVLPIACAREVGHSELLLAHHVGGAVLKSAGVPPPDLAGSLMVETASIDALVERKQIKPPDLVKIDVEGTEIEVLRGMGKVLRQWMPIVLVEIDDATAAGCEAKLSKCREYLHKLNYRTELLANAYEGGEWFVRHFVAKPNSHSYTK